MLHSKMPLFPNEAWYTKFARIYETSLILQKQKQAGLTSCQQIQELPNPKLFKQRVSCTVCMFGLTTS